MTTKRTLEERVANLESALIHSINLMVTLYGALIAIRWRADNPEMEKKLGDEIEAMSAGLDELIKRLQGIDQ